MVVRMHLAVLVIVASVSLMSAAPALAQARTELIPSLSLSTVYDDNLFARVDGSAGQILQLRPSVEASHESATVRLLGLYSFDAQRSNFSSLSTLDARRHALGEARLRTSPLTTLGVAVRYDRSDTPGDINVDTGVLGDRREAERLEVTPTLARRLSPRATITAGYNWTTEHLVDSERGALHVGRVSLSRELTTRTTLTGSYVGRSFVGGRGPGTGDRPSDDPEASDPRSPIPNPRSHSSHAALVGWNRQLSPGTRLTLSAGPKATSYRGLTSELAAAVARATDRVRLALDYWHGETIVLGIPGPVGVDSVTGRATWPVTRRIELGTHAGVSGVSTLDSRESTIYRGTLVGSWSPGGLYTIAASYGLDLQQGSLRTATVLDDAIGPFDDRVLRQVVRVSMTVAPRYRRSILPPDEAARAKGVTR